MTRYTRVKAKCMACGLHFLLCTWHPERHAAVTLHCPECGQHQGAFEVWREPVDGHIFAEVPGAAGSDADAEDDDKPLVAPPLPPRF